MNDVCQANGQCAGKRDCRVRGARCIIVVCCAAGEYVCDCGTSASVCDTDRNQCTLDQCTRGACTRSPINGGFCDDGSVSNFVVISLSKTMVQ